MFTIKPSLRLNMEGNTAFDTRKAPKVFNSKAVRIWSMVASATGPRDKSHCLVLQHEDHQRGRAAKAGPKSVRESGLTNSQGTCIVHDNVDLSGFCKDGLHHAFDIFSVGYIQNMLSNVWVLKSLHAFELSGRCIYDASSRSEFLASSRYSEHTSLYN